MLIMVKGVEYVDYKDMAKMLKMAYGSVRRIMQTAKTEKLSLGKTVFIPRAWVVKEAAKKAAWRQAVKEARG